MEKKTFITLWYRSRAHDNDIREMLGLPFAIKAR